MSLIKTYLHWCEEHEEEFMKLKKEEVWVPVQGHPNFMVSNFGRLWSFPRQGTGGGIKKLYEHKTYKPTHDKVGGYWGYKVGDQFYPQHLLMGRHFIPNPDNHPWVLHKDDDRTNNSLSNLYWGTPSKNATDLWDNGVRKRKTHTFTLTTGESVMTENLSQWCEERGVPINRVRTALHRGQLINPTPGHQDKWGNTKQTT